MKPSSNKLFTNIDAKERERLLANFDKIILAPQQTLLVEGEISDKLYILQSGQLEVSRLDPRTGNKYIIATIQPEEYVGELGIIDSYPRSATVYALTTSTLFVISRARLNSLEQEEPLLYSKLIKNLATLTAERLRKSNNDTVNFLTTLIKADQLRLNLGRLVITLLIIFSLYPIVLKALDLIEDYIHLPSTFIPTTSFLLILVLSIASMHFIYRSGYPLAFFGITTKNWRQAVTEGLFWSVIMIGLITFLKWIAILTIPALSHVPLIDVGGFYPEHGIKPAETTQLMYGITYVLFAPLQEFIARGCTQSSLKNMLLTPHATGWAIAISSLLFSSVHLSVGLLLSLLIFPFGLCWGLLYERHQTLIGVCISHILVGLWALYIVGVQRVLAF